MNSTKDSDAVEAQFSDDLTNELEYSGSFVELAIEDRVKERTLEYLEAKKEADIASVSKSVFLANLSQDSNSSKQGKKTSHSLPPQINLYQTGLTPPKKQRAQSPALRPPQQKATRRS